MPVDSTASREARVFVEALAAMGEVLYERVDEHVAGAGVERKNLMGARASRDDRNIGDPADIQRDAAKLRMAVEKIVDIGNERGALASESHVGGAKIRNRGDAGARGDDRTFADLKSRSGGEAEIFRRLTLVENRLAVITNEPDTFRGNLEFLARSKDSVCINVPETKVQLA